MSLEMIGSNIKTLREKHGISQADLARQLGLSRQSVSKWEMSQTTPSVEMLLALSELFGVSINEIIEGKSIISSINEVTAVEKNVVKITLDSFDELDISKLLKIISPDAYSFIEELISERDITKYIKPVSINELEDLEKRFVRETNKNISHASSSSIGFISVGNKEINEFEELLRHLANILKPNRRPQSEIKSYLEKLSFVEEGISNEYKKKFEVSVLLNFYSHLFNRKISNNVLEDMVEHNRVLNEAKNYNTKDLHLNMSFYKFEEEDNVLIVAMEEQTDTFILASDIDSSLASQIIKYVGVSQRDINDKSQQFIMYVKVILGI